MILAEQVNALDANLSKLSPRSFSFASSLVSQYKRKGYLSAKQAPYIASLLAESNGNVPTSVVQRSVDELGDYTNVIGLFSTAAQKLKYPKVTLRLFNENASLWYDIRLSVAGSRSAYQGQLNVTSADAYGDRAYYGRVSPAGNWTNGRDLDSNIKALLLPLLQKLAANPTATIIEYGKLTGHCAFCNLELSDAKSKAAGFGATCASNYGLTAEYRAAGKSAI
jgi:hypothetical protein